MKNIIFLSYAGDDKKIADYISTTINTKIGDYFYCKLVESEREGDTTFTEKIINYFKKCNVFIVILTKNSIHHQFVNQEWGYAKSLKEIGQIQIIQHLTERYDSIDKIDNTLRDKNGCSISYDEDGRIISKGFISSNMEFIDIIITNGQYDLIRLDSQLISFLTEKCPRLKPVYTEIQYKLERFRKEFNENILLIYKLITEKNNWVPEEIVNRAVSEGRTIFTEKEKNGMQLSMAQSNFSYDYALQMLSIGHLIDYPFIQKVEKYIKLGKELNQFKNLENQWALSHGYTHPTNTKQYYDILINMKNICDDLKNDFIKLLGKYELKTMNQIN